MSDPRFPPISLDSSLGLNLRAHNAAQLGRDGSIRVPTNAEIFDQKSAITIDYKDTHRGPIPFLEQIPPNTAPGTIIFIAHKDMGGDRASKYDYAFIFTGKLKNMKKKPKPKPPETIKDLFKGRTGKFNPPPHNVSRAISPTAFSNYVLTDSANATAIADLQRANKRGYIIEDIETALDAAGKPKTKVSQLWGFEFMYNPESFSHSVGASPYEVGNQEDTALALTGAQKLSLDLMINRVVDIPALKTFWLEKEEKVTTSFTGTDPDYPRAITKEDVEGIIKRGTEYDIDFLYRVVNGDPILGPTASVPISDFGYLMQVPVWLYINKDFKYKVIITDISITHYMFTEDMVPVMTKLTLNMFRIPDPTYGDSVKDDSTLVDKLKHEDGNGQSVMRQPVYGIPSDTNTGTTTDSSTGSPGWGSRNP